MSTSTTIIMAIIISFAVSVILCPIVIPILKKMKFGQYIREVGPKSHPVSYTHLLAGISGIVTGVGSGCSSSSCS